VTVCRPDHEPGPDCPNAPHTCLTCQPKAEARQAVLRDQFTNMLRDGAIAVTGDPEFVDAVLAGDICPHCELGLPHDCKRNGLAE
jgi:hypothetical protein